MGMSDRDRELGMDRAISRRDFMDGAARLVTGAAALSVTGSIPFGAAQAAANPAYPPSMLGLTGQTPQANKVAHALRDGEFWIDAPKAESTGETYDLVVVGGGISGLAAAFEYRRQAGASTKVLILENHDDLGGHARRNEFTASNGKTVIGYAGSQSLQTPSFFSPAVNKLLADIGLEVKRFETEWYDQKWAEDRGLEESYFFTKEQFGADALVKKAEKGADWVPNTPLSDTAKADLIKLIDAPDDYLPGKTREEKFELLAGMTYETFLIEVAKVDPIITKIYEDSTAGYFGVGIDATTALDAWANWAPGFGGMDLGDTPSKLNSPSGRLVKADPDEYIYHFPDGNHGVVRALVRALIPDAMPGRTMEDLVTTPMNYVKLDTPGYSTRIRLSSTVVQVKHNGTADAAKDVTVSYSRAGKLETVKAAHVVLACWHRVIPYIFEEVGEAQKKALMDQKKVPLIYTNVLLKNWKAFDALRIDSFTPLGHFWSECALDFPVSMGDYKFAQTPDDPIILHLSKVPGAPGKPARDQASAGRKFLLDLTFEEAERQIRDMLARALGPGGFDPARDIEGIAVNRWSHGYAYEYMRPWDAFWPEGPLPIEAARQKIGRVAIANSDSGAYAYVHSAIDQAVRAVRELIGAPPDAVAFADFPGPPKDKIGL